MANTSDWKPSAWHGPPPDDLHARARLIFLRQWVARCAGVPPSTVEDRTAEDFARYKLILMRDQEGLPYENLTAPEPLCDSPLAEATAPDKREVHPMRSAIPTVSNPVNPVTGMHDIPESMTDTEAIPFAIEIGKKLGRKFEDGDIFKAKAILVGAATAYLRDYTGDFEFLLDLKARRNGQTLSIPRARGILNCMMAEERRRPQPPTADRSSANPPTPTTNQEPVPDGTYTLGVGSGANSGHRTLRLDSLTEDQQARYNLPAGSQVAEFLSGPENDTDFTGFAFVIGRTPRIWRRFHDDGPLAEALRALLAATDEERREHGFEYALRSSRCYMCGRTLTVPASISRGVGPECSKKL